MWSGPGATLYDPAVKPVDLTVLMALMATGSAACLFTAITALPSLGWTFAWAVLAAGNAISARALFRLRQAQKAEGNHKRPVPPEA